MYNEFFGLRKAPFHLTPDPEFLYLTEQHREALAGLAYAILARQGFVVLTGDAGTGKTTLLARVLGRLPLNRIQSSVIVNPTLTPAEFLESILLDFGFEDIPASKAQRIAALQRFLWKNQRNGKVSALIVDEAHKLTVELLEEIRLLGNLESAETKLLQIVLIGQVELDEALNSEHLRQFKQRIALRLALHPLKVTEVDRYINHRWLTAGGEKAPFTPDAIGGISQASQGIPRVINVICENSLMQAFGEASATVEARHVVGVCRELRLFAIPKECAETGPVSAPPAAVPTAEAGADPNGGEHLSEPEAYPMMKTLERYSVVAARPSLLSRFAGKLGLMQKVETS